MYKRKFYGAVAALVLAAGMAGGARAQSNGWVAQITYRDEAGQVQSYEKVFIQGDTANIWAENAVARGFSRENPYGNGGGNERNYYPANRVLVVTTRAR